MTTDTAGFENYTMDQYKPFISEGYASLQCKNSTKHPIKIFHDNGASQSLLLEDVLPVSSTDATVLIQGVEGRFVKSPLHHVKLGSDLVSGVTQFSNH